jgi:hypothetical protein
MQKATNVILPFTPITVSRLQIVFAVQAILAVMFWSLSTSKSLPTWARHGWTCSTTTT